VETALEPRLKGGSAQLIEATAVRTSYLTTSARGLDFDSIPMRLFQKAKRLAWDPQAIDLTQDKTDWEGLIDLQRDSLMQITSQFLAGEEAVTLDLLPIVMWVAREGMLEEEIYLTSFLNEEAKHTEFFRRWLSDVCGAHRDLHEYMLPSYRRIFFNELPAAMNRVLTDHSREALARALVTYNMIVEGVLAETGYHSYATIIELQGGAPGLLQGIRLIARDESRHLRFAVYMLQRLISEDDAMWDVVKGRMDELAPLALGVYQEGHEWHLERVGELYGEIPEDYQAFSEAIHEDIINFAERQIEKRMAVLARARGQSRTDIEAADLDIEDDHQELAEIA
jgi:ribonucleoside-diphosphate reductase beta chain